MKIDRNHPIAQHVLSLLSSTDGWRTKGVNFIHLYHTQGYVLTVDRGFYMGELDPMVNIETSAGMVEFPVKLNKRWFGLIRDIDQSDPFVQGYKRVLSYCQSKHLNSILPKS